MLIGLFVETADYMMIWQFCVYVCIKQSLLFYGIFFLLHCFLGDELAAVHAYYYKLDLY